MSSNLQDHLKNVICTHGPSYLEIIPSFTDVVSLLFMAIKSKKNVFIIYIPLLFTNTHFSYETYGNNKNATRVGTMEFRYQFSDHWTNRFLSTTRCRERSPKVVYWWSELPTFDFALSFSLCSVVSEILGRLLELEIFFWNNGRCGSNKVCRE